MSVAFTGNQRTTVEAHLRSLMQDRLSDDTFDIYAIDGAGIEQYLPYYASDAWTAIDMVVPAFKKGLKIRWHVIAVFFILYVTAFVDEVSEAAGIIFSLSALILWFIMPVRRFIARERTAKIRNQLAEFLDEKYVFFWVEEVHNHREKIENIRREQRAVEGRPYFSPPDPQPFGISHRGAEHLCTQWMHHLGEERAVTTQAVGDGGIDIESPDYIAQVKNYGPNSPVGVPEVRELAGVASVDGRTPLFFTSGIYSDPAVEFADSARIALFIYSAEEGALVGANGRGKVFREKGL